MCTGVGVLFVFVYRICAGTPRGGAQRGGGPTGGAAKPDAGANGATGGSAKDKELLKEKDLQLAEKSAALENIREQFNTMKEGIYVMRDCV